MARIDFSNAGEQQSFDPVPDGTIVALLTHLKAGGYGDDGILTRSNSSESYYLSCESTVINGTYKGRKVWHTLMIKGADGHSGHDQAVDIARKSIKAMLESARGVRPDDKSSAANKARSINSYVDLDGLQFIAKLKIIPAQKDEAGNVRYPAKNGIARVLVPGDLGWRDPGDVSPDDDDPKPANNVIGRAIQAQAAMQRPQWAEDEDDTDYDAEVEEDERQTPTPSAARQRARRKTA
jgi:hypothetical protein